MSGVDGLSALLLLEQAQKASKTRRTEQKASKTSELASPEAGKEESAPASQKACNVHALASAVLRESGDAGHGEVQTLICRIPSCTKPVFVRANGRVHGYCGRSHAHQAGALADTDSSSSLKRLPLTDPKQHIQQGEEEIKTGTPFTELQQRTSRYEFTPGTPGDQEASLQRYREQIAATMELLTAASVSGRAHSAQAREDEHAREATTPSGTPSRLLHSVVHSFLFSPSPLAFATPPLFSCNKESRLLRPPSSSRTRK
jgi:hypothetical protein